MTKRFVFLAAGAVVLSLAATAQAAEDDFPGALALPGTDVRLKFGGYVKLDAIHDFNGMGSTDDFSVGTIPTDGSGVENTRFHARQTRLNLDARGPSDVGQIRTFFEGDFYGSNSSFRIRHAFGTLKGLLAGQTWTTFMDESALPPTLDYNEPQALVFERVGQVRYSHGFGESTQGSIALEEPTGSVSSSAGGTTETPWPFLATRIRNTGGRGHVQVSGFVGSLRWRPMTDEDEDVFLWGVNAAARINTVGEDHLILQGVYGEGVGAYRNGTVAALDGSGELTVLPEYGATVSYIRQWSKKFSTHAVVNAGWVDNSEGQDGSEVESILYSALNAVWHLTPRADLGLEYLYGERADKSGATGHNNRIQFSSIIRFH